MQYDFKNFFLFLLFLLFSFLLFSPSFLNVNFFWDDEKFIFSNPDIIFAPNWLSFFHSSTVSQRSWPIGYLLFWFFITKMHLSNIIFFKAFSIFLHSLNSFFICFFLKRLDIKFPILLSLIFLAHPLQVENVSWIFQQFTLLSFLFFISSCHYLLSFVRNSKKSLLLISYAFFAASIFSKSIPLFAPFLFLFCFCFLGQQKIVHYLLPFFVISAFGAYVTLGGIENKNQQIYKNKLLLSPQKEARYINLKKYYDFNQNLSQPKINFSQASSRLEIFHHASWFYLLKMIVPYPLSFLYPKKNYPLCYSFLSLMIFFISPILLFIRAKNARYLVPPILIFSFLTPYLGIVYIPFFYWANVSNRYAYFLILALISIFAAIINSAKFKSLSVKKYSLVIIIFLFSIQTINYGLNFNRPETLYEEAIVHNKNSILYTLLFQEYFRKQDIFNCERILNLEKLYYPDEINTKVDQIRFNSLDKRY